MSPRKLKPIDRLMSAVVQYGIARSNYMRAGGTHLGHQVKLWDGVGKKYDAVRRLALKLLREAAATAPRRKGGR